MNAPSLSGFFDIAQANYRLFDLGTHLKKMPATVLNAIDGGQPYLHPHMGYAWLVIVIWNQDQTEQNSLWFLKLPLDEQGIVPAAVHSDLISRLYQSLQEKDPKKRQQLLTEHPYQFTPDPQKMAALHANATKLLGLPPSQYFENVKQFYSQKTAAIQWQQLGIQGIADFACRLKDNDLLTLKDRLKDLEQEPTLALLQQFEHRALPTAMVEQLATLAQENPNNDERVNAILRACAQSPSVKILDPIIETRLNNADASLEFLLTVITRFTYLLKHESIAIQALDQLAQKADADGFERVITNLAMQPTFSNITMQTLGSSHLTETLANAISQLIRKKGKKNVQS